MDPRRRFGPISDRYVLFTLHSKLRYATDASDARLADFTAKDDVASSLAGKPELVQLLPRDLVPSTPDGETLTTALASSQFTGAISSLDEALKSGSLSMDTLKKAGVPEGTGIDYTSFLTALVDMKPSTGGDAMETD